MELCEELKMREPPPARPFDVAQGERPLTGMDSRLWRTYSPIGGFLAVCFGSSLAEWDWGD